MGERWQAVDDYIAGHLLGADDAQTELDDVATGQARLPGPEQPHVEHVPIKKKGSRKR